jgi:hypothetical protein
LWCDLPAAHRHHLAESGEGFVAMLVLLAMFLDEPLQTEREF